VNGFVELASICYLLCCRGCTLQPRTATTAPGTTRAWGHGTCTGSGTIRGAGNCGDGILVSGRSISETTARPHGDVDFCCHVKTACGDASRPATHSVHVRQSVRQAAMRAWSGLRSPHRRSARLPGSPGSERGQRGTAQTFARSMRSVSGPPGRIRDGVSANLGRGSPRFVFRLVRSTQAWGTGATTTQKKRIDVALTMPC